MTWQWYYIGGQGVTKVIKNHSLELIAWHLDQSVRQTKQSPDATIRTIKRRKVTATERLTTNHDWVVLKCERIHFRVKYRICAATYITWSPYRLITRGLELKSRPLCNIIKTYLHTKRMRRLKLRCRCEDFGVLWCSLCCRYSGNVWSGKPAVKFCVCSSSLKHLLHFQQERHFSGLRKCYLSSQHVPCISVFSCFLPLKILFLLVPFFQL